VLTPPPSQGLHPGANSLICYATATIIWAVGKAFPILLSKLAKALHVGRLSHNYCIFNYYGLKFMTSPKLLYRQKPTFGQKWSHIFNDRCSSTFAHEFTF